jgi:hypothetical protein
MRAPPLPKKKIKRIELDMRQCIHVRIMKETHSALRILLLQHKLSIQEVIDEMCRLLVSGDPFVENMLDNMVEAKRNRELRQLSDLDTEGLFRAIDAYSPLGHDNKKIRDEDF